MRISDCRVCGLLKGGTSDATLAPERQTAKSRLILLPAAAGEGKRIKLRELGYG